jgi:hypothetical protein
MPIANNVIADRVPGDSITASMFNQVKNGLAPELHAARHIRGAADVIPNAGEAGGLTAPIAPTLTYSAGTTGTLVFTAASIIAADPNSVTFSITYTFTASAVSPFTSFNVNPPGGWVISGISIADITISNGVPSPAGLNNSNLLYVSNPNTTARVLTCIVRLNKP